MEPNPILPEKAPARLLARLKTPLKQTWGYWLCLAVLAAAAVFLQLAEASRPLTNWMTQWLSIPLKRAIAFALDWYPWSGAELLLAAAVCFLIGFLVSWIVRFVRGRGSRAALCLRRVLFLLCAGLLLWNGFTFMWGIQYYADSFEEKSGIYGRASSPEELCQLTAAFARTASELAAQVERDEQGVYAGDREAILARARTIYRPITEVFPFLDGPELRPKKVLASELMSYLNLTGFLFPYTGEANVNNHNPVCFLPSTIAHELAHQRGVAPEQEANFVAILTCLSSGDSDYMYSGALLGYVHLSNALYRADPELWAQAASLLSQEVWNDLDANNAYWDSYEDTVTAQVSSGLNDSMLKSHGQELGTQSYGAVVDLLVSYYLDGAAAPVESSKGGS